jgi:hypothetical protein
VPFWNLQKSAGGEKAGSPMRHYTPMDAGRMISVDPLPMGLYPAFDDQERSCHGSLNLSAFY